MQVGRNDMKGITVSLLRLVAGFTFTILSFSLIAQPDPFAPKDQADLFWEAGRYQQALEEYQKILGRQPNNAMARFQLGRCQYELNQLDQAFYIFKEVDRKGKFQDSKLYFYLARTEHARHHFDEAAKWYKRYLKELPAGSPERAAIKDRILRCANGRRLKSRPSRTLVENFGAVVNTPNDEFYPVQSPNRSNRIYFSSARPGTVGGARDLNGNPDAKKGFFRSDMFSTGFQGGSWESPEALSTLLNGVYHDILLGFNKSGSQLYFFKGFTQYSGRAMVDTFRTRMLDRRLSSFAAPLPMPIEMEKGDRDPYFFNDSIFLFSSKRAGGYGGFDLYISLLSTGGWTPPENLGPVVNSPYDEVSPYLAKDGRTLYFSSNHKDRSIGGLDIFKTVYEEDTEEWIEPYNLGLPVNSAGDEEHFRLSHEGLKGYFDSDRKTGLGKRDLYVAFFRELLPEQRSFSQPLVFTQVPAYKKQLLRSRKLPSVIANDPSAVFSEEEIVNYELEPLFYEENGQILTGRNIKTVNTLAGLLVAYPQMQLMMIGHADGSDPEIHELHYLMNRLEETANYFYSKGVGGHQMILKAVGSAYPLANATLNGEPNPAGRRINRRSRFSFIKHNRGARAGDSKTAGFE
jgi:tetratricopeptide (TPR) repeat protein/outer membrane protein OmpA-like peptidoglycan-associated protein